MDDADLPGPEEIGGEFYSEFYHENGDAMDEETTEKMWHYYEQVNKLEEQHDAKKSETVGEFYDRAVRQIAGEKRTAKMFGDYLHRGLMVCMNMILKLNSNPLFQNVY